MALVRVVIFVLAYSITALAQPAMSPSSIPAKQDPAPIADNSFLIEEAFNQEAGVIQHISSFARLWDRKNWAFSFTQEWPFPGHEKHQLSFTLAAVSSGLFPTSGAGIGDVAINYRYQVAGGSDKRFSFSPRVSMLLPTGDAGIGHGYGGVGVQTNLPVSIYLNSRLVTHWNAGATFIPVSSNENGDRAFATGYNLGQSFIWLAHPRFNVMLETIWTDAESVVADNQTQRDKTLLISPGIRWAHNFKSGLQIVPGIGFPVGVGPSAKERGVILYLSFEHPLWGQREE
jgi:hypothetical protein